MTYQGTKKMLEIVSAFRDKVSDRLSDFIEFVEKLVSEYHESDFEIDTDGGKYRFIHKDDIDTIMFGEFVGDTYILGSFNPEFTAENTDLSYDIVLALQKAEQYETIGTHIIDNDYLSSFLTAYVNADGYGHHFAGYDGITIEDLLEETGYYCFRID